MSSKRQRSVNESMGRPRGRPRSSSGTYLSSSSASNAAAAASSSVSVPPPAASSASPSLVRSDNDNDNDADPPADPSDSENSESDIPSDSDEVPAALDLHHINANVGTKDVTLPWTDKLNESNVIKLVSTNEKDFVTYKRALETTLRIGGVIELITNTYSVNLALAKSLIPNQSVPLVTRRVQQLCERVKAVIMLSLGIYSEQVEQAFERRIALAQSIDPNTEVGSWDVHLFWQLVNDRYHTRSIYTAAHVYQQLLNQPQLREGETGANLCEKFHTLDKKLTELNDKSLTCNTITEGLLLHLAIKAIPAHWNITAGIVSQPDITMAAIIRAVDQYRLLKSGKPSVTGNVTHQRVNSATTVPRGRAPATDNNHKNRFKQRSQNSGYPGRNFKPNHNNTDHRSSHSSSDSSYSSHNNLNYRKGNNHTSFVFQAEPITNESDYVYSDNDEDTDTYGNSTAATDATPAGAAFSSDGALKRIDDEWILDSGASLHVSGSNYVKEIATGPPMRIRYANGVVNDVRKYGTVDLTSRVSLNNVAVVKNGVNLISLARILDSGCAVRFGMTRAVVKDKNGELILTFRRSTGSSLWTYKYENGTESLDHSKSITNKAYHRTIPRKNINTSNSSSNRSSSSSTSAADNARAQLNRAHHNRNTAGTSSFSSSSSSSSTQMPAPGAHYVHWSRSDKSENDQPTGISTKSKKRRL
jgi:hypothetical protein